MNRKKMLAVIATAVMLCAACSKGAAPAESGTVKEETDEMVVEDASNDKKAEEQENAGKGRVQSWFFSYDWAGCPVKPTDSLLLYGQYTFPFDPYEFIEANLAEFSYSDEEFFPDAEKDAAPVAAVPADIRRTDIYGPEPLSGRLKMNDMFVSIRSNKPRTDGTEYSLGEKYQDGSWEFHWDDYPHTVLGTDTEGSGDDREKLSRVIDFLGRPTYMYIDTLYADGAEDITEEFFDNKCEYYLVWELPERHYFSILVTDGNNASDFECHDFCSTGEMRYLEEREKPSAGNDKLYALINFNDIVK